MQPLYTFCQVWNFWLKGGFTDSSLAVLEYLSKLTYNNVTKIYWLDIFAESGIYNRLIEYW